MIPCSHILSPTTLRVDRNSGLVLLVSQSNNHVSSKRSFYINNAHEKQHSSHMCNKTIVNITIITIITTSLLSLVLGAFHLGKKSLIMGRL